MTADEFQVLWVEQSETVADEFYPKGVSDRRGEYLRDQGVLFVRVMSSLQEKGVISK